MASWSDGGEVDDADRQPAHRALAEGARLRPAAQQEERVGHVARQEVAVDGLEAGAAGVLDALVGDLDGLGPAADRGRGRSSGWPGSGTAHRGRPSRRAARSASRSRSIAPAGSLPQAEATASVVVAWISWARATGSQARATLIASRARRCASEKMPSSILSWASPARTVARSGLARAGTSSTARRAACIAPAGSPAARRIWASRSWSSPSRTRSRRASSPPMADFEEGRRPRHLPDREGRLRGADLEVDPVRARAPPAAAPDPSRRSRRRRARASSRAASSSAAA